jgi:hypothetical protein
MVDTGEIGARDGKPIDARSFDEKGSVPLSIKDATEAPPAEPGTVRLYRGGGNNPGGPKWVTTDRKYAERYTTPGLAHSDKAGSFLHYVDVPATDPRVQMPEGQSVHSFEAPPDIADQLQPFYRPKGALDEKASVEPEITSPHRDVSDRVIEGRSADHPDWAKSYHPSDTSGDKIVYSRGNLALREGTSNGQRYYTAIKKFNDGVSGTAYDVRNWSEKSSTLNRAEAEELQGVANRLEQKNPVIDASTASGALDHKASVEPPEGGSRVFERSQA